MSDIRRPQLVKLAPSAATDGC